MATTKTSVKTQRLLDSMPRSLEEAAVLASPSQLTILIHKSSSSSSSTTPSSQLAHPSQQHQLARMQPSTQYILNILPTFGIEDDDPIEDSTERIRISQQQPPRPLDKAMRKILDPQVIRLVHTVSQPEGIPLGELLCKPSQDIYN